MVVLDPFFLQQLLFVRHIKGNGIVYDKSPTLTENGEFYALAVAEERGFGILLQKHYGDPAVDEGAFFAPQIADLRAVQLGGYHRIHKRGICIQRKTVGNIQSEISVQDKIHSLQKPKMADISHHGVSGTRLVRLLQLLPNRFFFSGEDHGRQEDTVCLAAPECFEGEVDLVEKVGVGDLPRILKAGGAVKARLLLRGQRRHFRADSFPLYGDRLRLSLGRGKANPLGRRLRLVPLGTGSQHPAVRLFYKVAVGKAASGEHAGKARHFFFACPSFFIQKGAPGAGDGIYVFGTFHPSLPSRKSSGTCFARQRSRKLMGYLPPL